MKAGSGDSGATSFWAVVGTKSPPDDDLPTDDDLPIVLNLDILGTCSTREEALLFAESLGLDLKFIPFDPDYYELETTGRIIPFPWENP